MLFCRRKAFIFFLFPLLKEGCYNKTLRNYHTRTIASDPVPAISTQFNFHLVLVSLAVVSRVITNCTLHYITLHYITLHYITLRYVTLRHLVLHYIT